VAAAEGCGQVRRSLGVYILGAIAPADRAAVESHFARCAGCREELAGLASLPGRLGSVPAADVIKMDAGDGDPAGRGDGPPGLTLRSLLERAARVRRHLIWRHAAVAAAVVVIAGGGAVAVSHAVYLPAQRPAASALPWPVTVHGSDPGTGAAATVRYLWQPWGLALGVQVSGIPAGTGCELQVLGPDGREVAAGGWKVAAGDAGAWYPASSPVPGSGVHGFVVTTADGEPLVSVPVR
jgi:anti-sigma factor RsiW